MVFLAAVLNLEGEPPEKELPERELSVRDESAI